MQLAYRMSDGPGQEWKICIVDGDERELVGTVTFGRNDVIVHCPGPSNLDDVTFLYPKKGVFDHDAEQAFVMDTVERIVQARFRPLSTEPIEF